MTRYRGYASPTHGLNPYRGTSLKLKPDQLTPAIFALLFVSGACALVYQVVWARLFGEIFGSTLFAVSAVLAAFMSGLAIGSYALGKIADRSNNPLRLYGLYEIGIGVSALAVLIVFNGLTPVYLWLHDIAGHSVTLLSTGRFVLAFCLIIVPTTLMGATLPILTRFATDRIERLGMNVAGLYSINTAGAILGSLLAGFVLIRLVGIHVTIYLAVAVNIAAGGVAYWLARSVEYGDAGGTHPPETSSAAPVISASTARDHRTILWVLAISGFTAFAYEIYWTRALILVVGSSTYAFVTILSSFLTGIALGGWAIRGLLDRLKNPMRVFGWIEIAIGLTAAGTIPLVLEITDVGTLQNFLGNVEGNWDRVLALRFLTAFLVMLLPTLLIGATFPLVARIYATQLKNTGADVGRVYAVNTLGNIAGAIVPAFIVLPLIGIGRGILLMAVLNLAAGTLVFMNQRLLTGMARVAVPALVLALAVLAVLVPTKLQFPTGISPNHEIVFYQEGLAATTQVVVDRDDRQDKSIIVDGSGIGGTGIVDEKQQMLAHLPVLLHKDAASFLSIGLGSGILVGESAKHSQIERLKVVEIAPSVVAGSAYLSEENGDIHNNPKIDIEINDGVNYLLTTDQRYDIIASDAKTRPEYGSNGVFYSKDYYDLARQRLNSGGIFIQWLPLYLPHKDYATVLKTFIESFPHASLWFAPPGNSYLIGSEQPLQVDYAHVKAMLGDASQPLEGLRKYGITSADALLSHYVAGDEIIGTAVANARINSLEHPVIEFYALRDYAMPSVSRRMANLSLILELRRAATAGAPTTALSDSEAAGLAAAREAEELFVTGFKQVMESGPSQYEMIRYNFDEAINKSPKNEDIRYHIMGSMTSLARFALRQNNSKAAEEYAREATLVSNRAGEANCIYGQLLLARQETRLATRKFEACVKLRPQWVTARKALANIYVSSGRLDDAAEQFRALEALQPDEE